MGFTEGLIKCRAVHSHELLNCETTQKEAVFSGFQAFSERPAPTLQCRACSLPAAAPLQALSGTLDILVRWNIPTHEASNGRLSTALFAVLNHDRFPQSRGNSFKGEAGFEPLVHSSASFAESIQFAAFWKH